MFENLEENKNQTKPGPASSQGYTSTKPNPVKKQKLAGIIMRQKPKLEPENPNPFALNQPVLTPKYQRVDPVRGRALTQNQTQSAKNPNPKPKPKPNPQASPPQPTHNQNQTCNAEVVNPEPKPEAEMIKLVSTLVPATTPEPPTPKPAGPDHPHHHPSTPTHQTTTRPGNELQPAGSQS